VTERAAPDPGSFRDPSGQVYHVGDRILRGVDRDTLDDFRALRECGLLDELTSAGRLVPTHELSLDRLDPGEGSVFGKTWSGVLEHEPVPFVSYPYEWSYSMLQDAALLQLDILETALERGWSLKDASAYNVQWRGSRPVFIDIPSFEPREDGVGWRAYRQFAMMFLIPLMLRAHLGVSHNSLLRAHLDGIDPVEAARFFRGMARYRKGVPTHVLFPAMVERSIAKKERDGVPAKRRPDRPQSDAMVIGLVQSVRRLVRRLSRPVSHTAWSRYETSHSYGDAEFGEKEAFIEKALQRGRNGLVWDIGCNTGHFSRLAEKHADYVVAVDGDHDAVEQLYLRQRDAGGERILPLVMDLANISPAQGWAGQERAAFDRRAAPDLVMCLALIHHIRISANVPCAMFLDWLRGLGARVIIEFVERDDPMVVKLLTNRNETYEDYDREAFEAAARERFDIEDVQPLKGGLRRIYSLSPRSA
jgi:SAM-dependent methyltransferase